jgi:pilus assembly protein CpaB
MIARRLLLALCVAIAVSGVFTYWLSKKFGKSHSPSSQLSYVSTARPMEAGETLKPADIRQTNWPSTSPLAGAYLKPEDVTGRTVLYPLASGEPILDRQLSAAGAGSGLSPRIPDGMRALSLKSDQVVGVAGFLLPGTRVDVLVTYHTQTDPNPVTATVLQDAQILATGQKIQPDPEGKASTTDVVTLLVTPQDAEKVVLASAQGTVHFVLRNGADHGHTTGLPTQMSALGQIPADKPAAKVAINRPVAVAGPKPYSIEVTRGDKQTVETFR